jgi:hypothetical protein
MARAMFVKAARKDYPDHDIKKGESYWWWDFRFGGKHYSKTQPRASQLTQSGFLSQVYALNERLEDLDADNYEDVSDLTSELEEIAEEFRNVASELEDNKSNMPDGLQEGPTGELLSERAERCNEIADELDSLDKEIDEDALREQAKEEVKGEATPAPAAPAEGKPLVEVFAEEEKNTEIPEEEADDEVEERFCELRTERIQEIIDEAQGFTYDGE